MLSAGLLESMINIVPRDLQRSRRKVAVSCCRDGKCPFSPTRPEAERHSNLARPESHPPALKDYAIVTKMRAYHERQHRPLNWFSHRSRAQLAHCPRVVHFGPRSHYRPDAHPPIKRELR